MTDDRHRTEDVYELVNDRMDSLEGRFDDLSLARDNLGGANEIVQRVREHEQLMIDVPEMKETVERTEITVDVLADKMIGEKIPDPLRPGEFLINGRGEPMRNPRPKWPSWVGQAVIQALGVIAALLLFLAATA